MTNHDQEKQQLSPIAITITIEQLLIPDGSAMIRNIYSE